MNAFYQHGVLSNKNISGDVIDRIGVISSSVYDVRRWSLGEVPKFWVTGPDIDSSTTRVRGMKPPVRYPLAGSIRVKPYISLDYNIV